MFQTTLIKHIIKEKRKEARVAVPCSSAWSKGADLARRGEIWRNIEREIYRRQTTKDGENAQASVSIIVISQLGKRGKRISSRSSKHPTYVQGSPFSRHNCSLVLPRLVEDTYRSTQFRHKLLLGFGTIKLKSENPKSKILFYFVSR